VLLKNGACFLCPVFQPAPRGVKQEAQNTTLLFSTASTAFIFPRRCFLLFHALNLSPTFIFVNSIYR
jgi:hypothetical protein